MADDDLDDKLADGGDEPELNGDSPRKGGAKKLLILVLLPALLVIGGLAGAYFTGMLDGVIEMVTGESSPEGDAPAKGGPPRSAVFYEMEEMLVNLNTGGRRTSYLKVRISLELERPEDLARVEAVLPRVINDFQEYLRELRVEDLKGSAGMYRLREELLTRVNATVAPTKVNDVLFKEMLVQ